MENKIKNILDLEKFVHVMLSEVGSTKQRLGMGEYINVIVKLIRAIFNDRHCPLNVDYDTILKNFTTKYNEKIGTSVLYPNTIPNAVIIMLKRAFNERKESLADSGNSKVIPRDINFNMNGSNFKSCIYCNKNEYRKSRSVVDFSLEKPTYGNYNENSRLLNVFLDIYDFLWDNDLMLDSSFGKLKIGNFVKDKYKNSIEKTETLKLIDEETLLIFTSDSIFDYFKNINIPLAVTYKHTEDYARQVHNTVSNGTAIIYDKNDINNDANEYYSFVCNKYDKNKPQYSGSTLKVNISVPDFNKSKKILAKYKNNLADYQKYDLKYLLNYNRSIYYGDPGVGKTRTSLIWALENIEKNPVFFIVKPKEELTLFVEDAKILNCKDKIVFISNLKKMKNLGFKLFKDDPVFRPGFIYVFKDTFLNFDSIKNNIIKDVNIFIDSVRACYKKDFISDKELTEIYNNNDGLFLLGLFCKSIIVDEVDVYKGAKFDFERFYYNRAASVMFLVAIAQKYLLMSGTLYPVNTNARKIYYIAMNLWRSIVESQEWSQYKMLQHIYESYLSLNKEFIFNKGLSNSKGANGIIIPALRLDLEKRMVRREKDVPFTKQIFLYKSINFVINNFYMSKDSFDIYKAEIAKYSSFLGSNRFKIISWLNKLQILSSVGTEENFGRNKKIWETRKIIQEKKEKGEKIIVLFANSVSMKRFAKYYSQIFGNNEFIEFASDMTIAKRINNLEKFKYDKNITALFANVAIISRSYNIYEAATVLFVETDIMLVNNIQAFNRVIRPKQENNVEIIFLIHKDTIDEINIKKLFNFIDALRKADRGTMINLNTNNKYNNITGLLNDVGEKFNKTSIYKNLFKFDYTEMKEIAKNTKETECLNS